MYEISIILLIALFCCTVLPLVVYLCVKFGVFAYFKAKELVNRDHQNNNN